LKYILIGLCLGDLYIQKQYANARLFFVQGAPNREYLEHLYKLFSRPPMIAMRATKLVAPLTPQTAIP
jgi:hypothetical protein